MAAVGIDFGALHSKIGVARRRGVDIIMNEVSNRATPSLVSFNFQQRWLGEGAKTLEISNFRNTVGSLKRLIGRTVSDPEVERIEKRFVPVELVDAGGSVGAKVTYLGKEHVFSVTQLTGAYFGKLRDIIAIDQPTVSGVVIAIPGWFTDGQRHAILDAAQIANLNVLRLINDTTAIALGYGLTKTDLPEPENPRHVMFIDVGHSALSVAIVAFDKSQLSVKAAAYDRHVGGREIDYVLLQYFAKEFQTKYNIDVLSVPKATIRLATGCDKAKKTLSANQEVPLNVESIMNDIDAQSHLTRTQFEKLISPLLERIPGPIQQALAESGLTLEQIDAVELVGGCTRIPCVRAKIQSALGNKPLSTTLNADEAAARGATLACAMLSPTFRVRPFAVHDITPYSVKVKWAKQPEDPDEDTELIVFPKGNSLPSTKILTFYRRGSFSLEVEYAEPAALPGGINPWIASFTAKEVPADPNGDATCVKIKIRLNLHGVVSFEQAYTEEIEETEDAMPVDGEEAPKKKRVVKKKEVPFVWSANRLESAVLEQFKQQEAEMQAADKLVMDTLDRKNAFEAYIYDMRDKVRGRYASYVQPEEKEKLLQALAEAEEWLLSPEGEDSTKSVYIARLDGLQALGDPIVRRYKEDEERPRVTIQLRETINKYMNQATSEDEKNPQFDEKDKQSLVEKCATIQKWLEDQLARQSERPKNVDPIITTAEILKKNDEIILFTASMPKLKPKVSNTGTETPKSGQQTPKPEPQPQPNAEQSQANNGPPEMDID